MCFLILAVCFASMMTLSQGVPWGQLKCDADKDTADISDGYVPNMGRFPWLGIIQHGFYLYGKSHYAVTTGILIHPGWLMASAEDISKIPLHTMVNNTKFIAWRSPTDKVVLEVDDYVLHPEFMDKDTFSSIALLQLDLWSTLHRIAPLSPVCLPIKGGGTFENLYNLKMTDDRMEMEKEIFRVDYVNEAKCNEFYDRAKLNYKKMAPTSKICTVYRNSTKPCVWDAGAVLITKQNFGYWMLLGFGIRGPGCGAPARFIYIHSYLNWIDDVIMNKQDDSSEMYSFGLRRLAPESFVMYPAEMRYAYIGQCGSYADKGGILFKESTDIGTGTSLAIGYYFVEVWQIAQFQCVKIDVISSRRTNAAVWLEHHCHPDMHGQATGMTQPDHTKRECFYYFKSTAFIEFRFLFSYKADLEVTLYGFDGMPDWVPNPWRGYQSTDAWWPTDVYLRKGGYSPYYLHLWYL